MAKTWSHFSHMVPARQKQKKTLNIKALCFSSKKNGLDPVSRLSLLQEKKTTLLVLSTSWSLFPSRETATSLFDHRGLNITIKLTFFMWSCQRLIQCSCLYPKITWRLSQKYRRTHQDFRKEFIWGSSKAWDRRLVQLHCIKMRAAAPCSSRCPGHIWLPVLTPPQICTWMAGTARPS